MKDQISPTLKLSRVSSIIFLLFSLSLITYMISVEGELGALPLFLTIVGLAWFGTTMYKIYKFNQKNKS